MMDLQAQLPRLLRYARSLSRDNHSAEDIVQNALIRALDKQDKFEHGTDLRAWLFTILHNTYVNTVRKGARDPTVYGEENTATIERYQANSDPSAGLIIRDLKRALEKLPVEQQRVLILVGVEGYKYEQVAEYLKIPLGTVRSRLSRGRKNLQQLMGM